MGAGGGGFLMLYCPRKSRELEDFMMSRGLPRMYYNLEHEGVKVMANLATSDPMVLRSYTGASRKQPIG
jgi:hypothetical protein